MQTPVDGAREDGTAAVVRAMLEDLDDVSARLATRIESLEPAYRNTESVTPEDLRGTCGSHVAHVLRQLSGRPRGPLAALRETGRRRAAQGVPLESVLHAIRIGGSFIWQELLDRTPPSRRVELLDVVSAVWTAIEDYSGAVTDGYREYVFEQTIHTRQVRAAIIASVLDGSIATEPRLSESASLLGLPLTGRFVVVAAPSAGIGDEPLPGVESALQGAGLTSAWRLAVSEQIGLAQLSRRHSVSQLADCVGRLAHSPIGVSEEFATLTDAPLAAAHARLAAAAAPHEPPYVLHYDLDPTAVLLAGSPDLSRRLREGVLGPLLELPEPECAALLGTLRVWLEGHGSLADTAQALHVHRNTLYMRIRRIEEVTGRTMNDPRGASELRLAMEALRIDGYWVRAGEA